MTTSGPEVGRSSESPFAIAQTQYEVAADHLFPGELTTDEALAVLDDLAAFGIPALILSGGRWLEAPMITGMWRCPGSAIRRDSAAPPGCGSV